MQTVRDRQMQLAIRGLVELLLALHHLVCLVGMRYHVNLFRRDSSSSIHDSTSRSAWNEDILQPRRTSSVNSGTAKLEGASTASFAGMMIQYLWLIQVKMKIRIVFYCGTWPVTILCKRVNDEWCIYSKLYIRIFLL